MFSIQGFQTCNSKLPGIVMRTNKNAPLEVGRFSVPTESRGQEGQRIEIDILNAIRRSAVKICSRHFGS